MAPDSPACLSLRATLAAGYFLSKPSIGPPSQGRELKAAGWWSIISCPSTSHLQSGQLLLLM